MQINIVEAKTKVKNVNAYNKSSLLGIKQDKPIPKVACK